MLAMQANLFETRQPEGFEWIGAGCYGKVWKHPDGETVFKRGSQNDGTMAYIYWCHEMQKAGCGMRGMPEVHSFALLADHGWIATMKLYKDGCDVSYDTRGVATIGGGRKAFNEFGCGAGLDTQHRGYMYDLMTAWDNVCQGAFHHPYKGRYLGDLHDGNFMWDADSSTLVMIDPSGAVDNDLRSNLWKLLPHDGEGFALVMQ